MHMREGTLVIHTVADSQDEPSNFSFRGHPSPPLARSGAGLRLNCVAWGWACPMIRGMVFFFKGGPGTALYHGLNVGF